MLFVLISLFLNEIKHLLICCFSVFDCTYSKLNFEVVLLTTNILFYSNEFKFKQVNSEFVLLIDVWSFSTVNGTNGSVQFKTCIDSFDKK